MANSEAEPQHLASYIFSPWFLLLLFILYYLIPWLQNDTLRGIPGPFIAKFSNIWLLLQARQGKRYQKVDEMHAKYGKLVRIQPDHCSVADDAAIPLIYGHGNGFLKRQANQSLIVVELKPFHSKANLECSEFYDAFVSIHRGLFNTRDRAEHTRKRKIVSHTFSAKAVGEFEPYMRNNLQSFVSQMDRISSTGTNGGYAKIDAVVWFNFLAFDIIGDLAFGTPFGMLDRGKDVAEVRETPDSPPKYVSAIETLNRRGETSATLGCLPGLKPYSKYLPDPFFRNGLAAVENLAGIAIARVKHRLENAESIDRMDLLARLMEGSDAKGEKMGRSELTAEALTQLIAGSDTTSNTSSAILYWCLKTPHVVPKLQQELDEALGTGDAISEFSSCKDLP